MTDMSEMEIELVDTLTRALALADSLDFGLVGATICQAIERVNANKRRKQPSNDEANNLQT